MSQSTTTVLDRVSLPLSALKRRSRLSESALPDCRRKMPWQRGGRHRWRWRPRHCWLGEMRMQKETPSTLSLLTTMWLPANAYYILQYYASLFLGEYARLVSLRGSLLHLLSIQLIIPMHSICHHPKNITNRHSRGNWRKHGTTISNWSGFPLDISS